MQAASPKAIIFRRTHTLVYCADEYIKDGHRELMNWLTLREKDMTGASWVTFSAHLTDVDTSGRKILRLPGNVPLALLHAAWPTHTVVNVSKPWNKRAISIKFHTHDYPFRSSVQSTIVDYLVGRNTYSYYTPGASRLVQAGTATGKSYCVIRAWAERSDVLLGTFAQMGHLINFKTDMLKFTDLTEDEILVIDDGRADIQRMLKDPDKLRTYKAILVLHRTIWNSLNDNIEGTTVKSDNGLCEFVKFAFIAGIGTHVSDEAHFELRSLIYLGLFLNVDQTYYLTATPNRTDWREDRLLGMQLPRDHALIIKTEARLNVVQVAYNSNPNIMDIKKSKNIRDYFDIPRFFDYLMRPDKWVMFEEMLTTMVSRALIEGGATSVGIVVAGKLEFLDKVIDSLKLAFPNRTIGNYSSRVKAGQLRTAELDRDIVVTTEKSFNGSVNPLSMTHMIFFAPITSPVAVEQISGRLRGIDGAQCMLFDMWDEGFPALIEQAKRRKTIFKKISKDVKSFEYVKDYDLLFADEE